MCVTFLFSGRLRILGKIEKMLRMFFWKSSVLSNILSRLDRHRLWPEGPATEGSVISFGKKPSGHSIILL